jgi:hypothetical protein
MYLLKARIKTYVPSNTRETDQSGRAQHGGVRTDDHRQVERLSGCDDLRKVRSEGRFAA